MAGILFTDTKLALVGYKSYKGHITGIGGKQKANESLFYCAIRETLEELFDVSLSPKIIEDISMFLRPFHIAERSGYTQYLCSFQDLSNMLWFMALFLGFTSTPMYPVFPTSLEEILMNRIPNEKSELSHLALIPFVMNLRIANHLINDINHALTPVSTMSNTQHTDTSKPHSRGQSSVPQHQAPPNPSVSDMTHSDTESF